MTRYSKVLRHVLVVTAFTASACSMMPKAETVALKATLSSASEVPPNTSAATGAVEASYDAGTNVLRWKVRYSGLSGDATGAHFHGPAAAGQVTGVVVPFKGSIVSPFEGEATLTPAQAADMLDGKWYANVHTAANPGGEIRGQLERVK